MAQEKPRIAPIDNATSGAGSEPNLDVLAEVTAQRVRRSRAGSDLAVCPTIADRAESKLWRSSESEWHHFVSIARVASLVQSVALTALMLASFHFFSGAPV
jgi:hypothetical protein